MEQTNGKRIAIVTGSALGLGYELTRQLIDRGWFVAGIDFNAERQTELAGEFPGALTTGSSATCPTRTSSKPRWPRSPRSGTSTC